MRAAESLSSSYLDEEAQRRDCLRRRRSRPSTSSGALSWGGKACSPPRKSNHQHSHDLLGLEKWVERVGRNPTGKGRGSIPRALFAGENADPSVLVSLYSKKADGYDACFTELARQVHIHCPRLAGLLEKTWQGHSSMFRVCLRLFKEREKSILQTEEVLCQRSVAAEQKRADVETHVRDKEVECLVLEAKLRERVAEQEAMRAKVKYYEDEVRRLRNILSDRFFSGSGVVESREVHDSITVADDENEEPSVAITLTGLMKELLLGQERQDLELTEILKCIHAEGEVQSDAVAQLQSLVEDIRFEDFLEGMPQALRVKKRTVQTQTSSNAFHKQAGGVPPPMHFGAEKEEPNTTSCENDPFGAAAAAAAVASAIAAPYSQPLESLGQKVLPAQLRNGVPVSISETKQIPTLLYMLRTSLDFLQSMVSTKSSLAAARAECAAEGSMAALLMRYFQNRAQEDWAGSLTSFIMGLRHFKAHYRCRNLGEFLGVFNRENDPPHLNRRDSLFMLDFLSRVRGSEAFKELKNSQSIVRVSRVKASAALKECLGPYMASSEREENLIEAAVPCMSLSQDSPLRGVRKSVSQSQTHVIDLDLLVEETMLAWSAVCRRWEEHISFAFDSYSAPFHVIGEMRFADDGTEERDSVIMIASKRTSSTRLRRRLRRPSQASQDDEVMVAKSSSHYDTGNDSSFDWILDGRGDMASASSYRSSTMPVVDLLTEEACIAAIQYLNPTIGEESASDVFKGGLRFMHAQLMLSFSRIWKQKYSEEYEKQYWEHSTTGKTQWTRPWDPECYERKELDKQAFIEVCLHCRVVQESPLIRHFCVEPSTLYRRWDSVVGKLQNPGSDTVRGGGPAVVAQSAVKLSRASYSVEGLLSGDVIMRNSVIQSS